MLLVFVLLIGTFTVNAECELNDGAKSYLDEKGYDYPTYSTACDAINRMFTNYVSCYIEAKYTGNLIEGRLGYSYSGDDVCFIPGRRYAPTTPTITPATQKPPNAVSIV